MEKREDPVDKVEGATSLAPEKKEDGNKEVIPGEGTATIDSAKEETTEEAVSDKQESSKEDSNAPCISSFKMPMICAASCLSCLLLGLWFMTQFSKGTGYKIWTGFFMTFAFFFFGMALYYITRKDPDSAVSDPSTHYEDTSDARSEGVVTRRIGTSSEYFEAIYKQRGASSSGVPLEKQLIFKPLIVPFRISTGHSVMQLSKIASDVSQIASGSMQEGPAESVQEKSKGQNVGEKADDNLQNDSEQEGLSSTELRRRNLQNPDSCTDLTLPSGSKE